MEASEITNVQVCAQIMLCFRNIEYSGGIVSELMRKKLIIIISENIDVSAKSSTCIPINLK